MKRLSMALTLGLTLITAAPAVAHEGHAHRIMGTVASVQGQQLEVKATTGKTAVIVVTDKTRIVRGATAQTIRDIKAGDRVVVTATETKDASGRERVTATEVKLGAAAGGSSKGI